MKDEQCRHTERQGLRYVVPLWTGNFRSLADRQLGQQWRGLLNQLLQKQHRAGCSSAFVSPRLRARDENGSVKQLVTCLSKKNVKQRPQKLIMASVVSTLTQFLALLRDRCAFGYAYSQSEPEIVSSLKNELHLTFKSQHELPFAIHFTDFNEKQDF